MAPLKAPMNTDAQTPPFPKELLHHVKWVQVLARQLVSDHYLADEIAQETWLAALKNPPAPEAARSWFWKVLNAQIARAYRVNSARKAREIKTVARRTDPDVAEGAGHAFERAMLHQQVVSFTLELEEPYRSAVLLRYIEGLDPKGIAERLDVPINTVQSRLRRGLEKLRERLEREHGSNGAWCEALLVLCLNPMELSALRFSRTLSWAKMIGPIASLLVGCSLYFNLLPDDSLTAAASGASDARAVEFRTSSMRALAPPATRFETGRAHEVKLPIHSSRRPVVGTGLAHSSPLAGSFAAQARRERTIPAAASSSSMLRPGDLVVTSSGAGCEGVLRADDKGSHVSQTTSGTGFYWVGNALLPEGGWVCAAVSGEDVRIASLNLFEAGSGKEIASFATPEIGFPGDVAVFADGTLVVSDRAAPCVQLYHRDGSYQGSIRFAGGTAWGIHVDEHDQLWVADPIRHTVLRFERSGRLLSVTDLTFLPGDLVVAPDGTFWITDHFAGCASHLTVEGELLERISLGLDSFATGIALTSDGVVWLSTHVDRTVRGFTSDGRLVSSLQCPEGFQPEFLSVQKSSPEGVAFCSADGASASRACPCTSGGGQGEGCANSTGLGGKLAAFQGTQASVQGLDFRATQIPAHQPVILYLSGAASLEGALIGDGLSCLSASAAPIAMARSDAHGVARFALEPDALPGLASGSHSLYQAIYRDPSSGACRTGFNTTNALAFSALN